MKFTLPILSLLVVTLGFVGCSKHERQTVSRQKFTKNLDGMITYRDEIYPLSLTYSEDSVDIFMTKAGELMRGVNAVQPHHIIECEMRNYYEVFPGAPLEGLDSSAQFLRVSVLNKEQFEEGLKSLFSLNLEKEFEEVNVGDMQALRFYGEVETYILLTPGYYIEINVFPFFMSTIAEKMSQVANGVLKGFRWEQPIDTSSQEFKEWKAHILSLLEEAKK